MSDICRAARWFSFGHKFEPRYDLTAGKPLEEILGYGLEVKFSGNLNGLIEKSRAKTYVHDICVRCGEVVSRAAT